MLWILIALIAPLTQGLANVLDSYFINNPFKNPTTLIFFSASLSLIFLPLIFLIQIPSIPPIGMLLPLMLTGFLNVAYAYPYYKALQRTDVSSVSALFSLGKILVPILAFLIVGEILSISQYAGFLIIVVGAFLLSIDFGHRLKVGKALPLMALASFATSLESVVYKFVLNSISWSTALSWSTVFSLIFISVIVLVSRQWRPIFQSFSRFRSKLPLLAGEELLTFTGSAAVVLAISLAPVTLVKGITALQPIFVLVIAVILKKQYKHFSFKEEVHRRALLKKVILFIAIIIGSILIGA